MTMARTKACDLSGRDDGLLPVDQALQFVAPPVQDTIDKIKRFGIPFLKDLPTDASRGFQKHGEERMNHTAHVGLLTLVGLVATCVMTQPSQQNTPPEDSKNAIERVLRTQQDAWNHHDLDAFMAGYWNSPDLTFFSGAKQTAGWQATLDRYRATYASPGHEMGTLDFSALRIEMLGPDAAFVRGAWHLTLPDGKTPHGLFTLTFRKFPNGWKIIHDHTSAA
jgi:uncharacterized protein (TIGR02246 family)